MAASGHTHTVFTALQRCATVPLPLAVRCGNVSPRLSRMASPQLRLSCPPPGFPRQPGSRRAAPSARPSSLSSPAGAGARTRGSAGQAPGHAPGGLSGPPANSVRRCAACRPMRAAIFPKLHPRRVQPAERVTGAPARSHWSALHETDRLSDQSPCARRGPQLPAGRPRAVTEPGRPRRVRARPAL